MLLYDNATAEPVCQPEREPIARYSFKSKAEARMAVVPGSQPGTTPNADTPRSVSFPLLTLEGANTLRSSFWQPAQNTGQFLAL